MSSSVRTELHRSGGRAEFVVRCLSGPDESALLKMGWARTGADCFSRILDDTPDIERIFDNFARHLPTMLRQSSSRAPARWHEALSAFHERVEGSSLQWWLYGSAALALRGLELPVGDVDLVVDDAALAAELLDDLLIEPVTHHDSWVASWTGRAFHGAVVEWLADAHPTGLRPPSEQEPAARDHLDTVRWRGHQFAVTNLRLAYASAARRGLTDRVDLIRRVLTGEHPLPKPAPW